MQERPLGGSGVAITRIVLGCGNFGGIGSSPTFFGQGTAKSDAFRLMDTAWDLGITTFDTAVNLDVVMLARPIIANDDHYPHRHTATSTTSQIGLHHNQAREAPQRPNGKVLNPRGTTSHQPSEPLTTGRGAI